MELKGSRTEKNLLQRLRVNPEPEPDILSLQA